MSSSTNSSNIQTTNSTSNNDNNVDENKSPLQFKILATDGCARACEMILPHGTCYTPMFMPGLLNLFFKIIVICYLTKNFKNQLFDFFLKKIIFISNWFLKIIVLIINYFF